MAGSENQSEASSFVDVFGADEFTFSREEIAVMAPIGGYLLTVTVNLPQPWSFVGGSATLTSNGEFFTGPALGWSSSRISFAAGYTVGGTPAKFSEGTSIIAGAGLVFGATLDGGIRFYGIGTPQLGGSYGTQWLPNHPSAANPYPVYSNSSFTPPALNNVNVQFVDGYTGYAGLNSGPLPVTIGVPTTSAVPYLAESRQYEQTASNGGPADLSLEVGNLPDTMFGNATTSAVPYLGGFQQNQFQVSNPTFANSLQDAINAVSATNQTIANVADEYATDQQLRRGSTDLANLEYTGPTGGGGTFGGGGASGSWEPDVFSTGAPAFNTYLGDAQAPALGLSSAAASGLGIGSSQTDDGFGVGSSLGTASPGPGTVANNPFYGIIDTPTAAAFQPTIPSYNPTPYVQPTFDAFTPDYTYVPYVPPALPDYGTGGLTFGNDFGDPSFGSDDGFAPVVLN
ncbi:hypothetical protein WDZ92_33510, partial [Nostoc sp. NIES-2111]